MLQGRLWTKQDINLLCKRTWSMLLTMQIELVVTLVQIHTGR